MGAGQSKDMVSPAPGVAAGGVGGGATDKRASETTKKMEGTTTSSSNTTLSETNSTTAAHNRKKEQEGGGCPYKGPFGGWGGKKSFEQVHGKGGAMPLAETTTRTDDNGEATSSKEGGCPYKGPFGGWGGGGKKGKSKDESLSKEEESSSACPYRGDGDNDKKKKEEEKGVEYNVYSQPVTEQNRLAAVGNNLPNARQKQTLSTDRVQSTIPKGTTDEKASTTSTWTYPSPQMFFNALARKNKLTDDTTEEDMESVVAIHNNMNERTWAKILQWEALANSDGQPKLLKFMGRPSDLSWKARVKHYVWNHPLPFDRHDWTVQRSDGTLVRYIIDYYHDDHLASATPDSGRPALDDFHSIRSIVVDVRPAVDGPRDAWARSIQMPYARFAGTTSFAPLPLAPSPTLATQVEESQKVWGQIQQTVRQSKERAAEAAATMVSGTDGATALRQQQQISQSFTKALQECQEAQRAVDACVNDETCTRASLDLTMCMGVYLCPVQHQALLKVLQSSGDDNGDEQVYEKQFQAALENLTLCVGESNQLAQEQGQKLMASSSSSA